MHAGPHLVAFALVAAAAAGALAVTAAARPEIVEVKPVATDELLANPGMGWETFHCFANTDRSLTGLPSSTAYFRWYWRELEPQKDKVNFDLLDSTLRSAREAGQKLAFRVMVCGTDKAYSYSPGWLSDEGYAGFEYSYGREGKYWAPDLDDPAVLERHLKLISALGARYDGHPDLAHVDIGSVGLWGEWHMSDTGRDMPRPETCKKVVDAYLAAFPHTPLVMLIGPLRELRYAASKGAGWRADCLGDMGGFSKTWSHMRDAYPQQIEKAALADVWQHAPVAFETCWDMRKWKQEGWDIDYIFNWALAQHASYVNNKSAPLPEGTRGQVEQFLRKLGYRFVLRSLKHPASVERGGRLHVEMEWENVGVAPTYVDYAPAVSLVDAAGKRVWTGPLTSSTLKWLPGPVTVAEDLQLPAELAPGQYGLEIAIVDRRLLAPVVRLAVAGRAESGWYPLSRIAVR